MINRELKPTFDNLKNSLLGDWVGRNEGIADFIKFLDIIEGNIAIALNGGWGNGKTFFVKQTQMVLESCKETNTELADIKICFDKYFKDYSIRRYLPVYYDAWSNDNDDDPILSIIFTMLQNIDDLREYEATDRDWWEIFTNGLDTLATTFSGTPVKKFLDSVKGKDVLGGIAKTKETEHLLNQILDTLLQKQPEGTRIIFFIDELDRCCPNYAVRLIERIKHYFLHERLIFVLSVNELELQHTIKRHYGNEFNADKYLRRFFDFALPLPMANMEKYYRAIHFDTSIVRWKIADIVIREYNFSLREITRYLQHLETALPKKYNKVFSPENAFYVEVLAPFLIGLNIHDSTAFYGFINGESMTWFLDVLEGEDIDWYCQLLLERGKESFDSHECNSKTVVSLAERFKPVYECLFGKLNLVHRSVKLPGCEIQSNDRKFLLGMVSLKYANHNLTGENNGTN